MGHNMLAPPYINARRIRAWPVYCLKDKMRKEMKEKEDSFRPLIQRKKQHYDNYISHCYSVRVYHLTGSRLSIRCKNNLNKTYLILRLISCGLRRDRRGRSDASRGKNV